MLVTVKVWPVDVGVGGNVHQRPTLTASAPAAIEAARPERTTVLPLRHRALLTSGALVGARESISMRQYGVSS